MFIKHLVSLEPNALGREIRDLCDRSQAAADAGDSVTALALAEEAQRRFDASGDAPLFNITGMAPTGDPCEREEDVR